MDFHIPSMVEIIYIPSSSIFNCMPVYTFFKKEERKQNFNVKKPFSFMTGTNQIVVILKENKTEL